MKKPDRRGFIEIIELLVVLFVLYLIGSFVLSLIDSNSHTKQAVVVEKLKLGNGDTQIKIQKSNGETETWGSFWVHDKVDTGSTYEFKLFMGVVTGAEEVEPEVEPEE